MISKSFFRKGKAFFLVFMGFKGYFVLLLSNLSK